jgi:hypothetical protein
MINVMIMLVIVTAPCSVAANQGEKVLIIDKNLFFTTSEYKVSEDCMSK